MFTSVYAVHNIIIMSTLKVYGKCQISNTCAVYSMNIILNILFADYYIGHPRLIEIDLTKVTPFTVKYNLLKAFLFPLCRNLLQQKY